MGDDEEFANTTLDDLINKEMSSRKQGVGKRFSRGRGRGRGRGRFGNKRRGRGGGRRNLRPSSRPFGGFHNRGRFRRRGGRGRNNFRRRFNDEPEWRNDKYEERFHGSATSSRTRSSNHSRRREPENFTTKSGLTVSVGSGSSNPDLGCSVQIKGLHSNVQSEDLREILQKYGAVKYAYITYDENNESQGVGRACFAKAEFAKEAVKDLHDATIDGVSIKITYLGGGYDGGRDRRSFRSRRGRGGRDERDSDIDMDDSDKETSQRRDSKYAPDTPFNPLAR